MSAIGAALKKMFARPYATVGPAEAVALVDAGAVLLDVRESAEWAAGHAPRARHIALGELPGRAAELPAGRPVVTVCRSGMRSSRAAALLGRQGYEVSNLAGGMEAWQRAGLPVVAKGGRPGRIG